jgi:hypothetical protein
MDRLLSVRRFSKTKYRQSRKKNDYRSKDLLSITDVVGLEGEGAGILNDGVVLAGLLLVLVPLLVLRGEVCPPSAPLPSAASTALLLVLIGGLTVVRQ